MKINSVSNLITQKISFAKKTNQNIETPKSTTTKPSDLTPNANIGLADVLINKKRQYKIEGQRLFTNGTQLQQQAQELHQQYKKMAESILSTLTDELNKTPDKVINSDNFSTFREYDNGFLIRETRFNLDENKITLKHTRDYDKENNCNYIEYNDDNTIKSITLGIGKKIGGNDEGETEFLYNKGKINIISSGITLDFDNLALNIKERYFFDGDKLKKVQKGIHDEDESALRPIIDFQFTYENEKLKKAEEGLLPKLNPIKSKKPNIQKDKYISDLTFRY